MSALVSFSQTTDVNPTNNLNPSRPRVEEIFRMQELVRGDYLGFQKPKNSRSRCGHPRITAEDIRRSGAVNIPGSVANGAVSMWHG